MRRRKLAGPNLSTLYTHEGGVLEDSEFRLALIGAGVTIDGTGISFNECILRRSTIVHATGLQVRDSLIDTVDAANANLERSGWGGSAIKGTRFTGAKINSSHISRTTFLECRMNLVQCQLTTIQATRFENCDLRGAFFNGSTMSGTVFEGSDLTGADFSGAVITGADFRRATIDEIRVSPEQMAGVIVTIDQALYLARLFGLDIQE